MTGNTLSVGENLKEYLDECGHRASIERLRPTVDEPKNEEDIEFSALPELDQYEAVIFATPVHAFSLPPVVSAYLKLIPSLAGKQIACFVTKKLPFRWTGGNQTIGQIRTICEEKDGDMTGSEIVICSGSGRDDNIRNCVENLGKLFSNSN